MADESTQQETDHNTHRINRRTAFVVLSKLDREFAPKPGLLHMMRELVKHFGVDGTLARVKFPPHIPQEAVGYQRLCLEYLAFEEGAADEQELIASQQEAQRELKRIDRQNRRRMLRKLRNK